MKKKVVKKSSTHKVASAKRVGKKHWSQLLPFKFSIISVAILGCLTLVAWGMYNLLPKTDVLGAATQKLNTPMNYVKFVTTSPSITKEKYDLGLYVSTFKDSKYNVLSKKSIYLDLQPGKVIQIPGIDSTKYVIIVAFINYRVGNKTNNYSGEKGVTGDIIMDTPTAYQYANSDSPCTNKDNPCKFTFKLVAPTPTPTPAPTKCTTSNKTTCYGNQVCTQISSSCSTLVHYTNCRVRPGYCGVSQKTSRGIQQ